MLNKSSNKLYQQTKFSDDLIETIGEVQF